ncbi:hypothetical protein QBC46DRAFT_353938 [Diplogelasinospora grovesii]|uniref:Uncharacterized protein n=1 Tax=Diplogelasinospora grovesii TaxID=303347 RepID=A0AAN6N7I6_9PEZI|nr:hypothetical protein QBC46DRAFT_353938 [Diplogelasinospora grovesii]
MWMLSSNTNSCDVPLEAFAHWFILFRSLLVHIVLFHNTALHATIPFFVALLSSIRKFVPHVINPICLGTQYHSPPTYNNHHLPPSLYNYNY